VTTVGGQHAVSAEDRLSLLIDRLLTSMDAAAAAGTWDRVVELANDVLTVDPPNQRAAAMIKRASLERSLPEGERAFVSLIFADIVQSTDMAEVAEPEVVREVFAVYREVATHTIEELGGRVLQFQGDGVVACFGYPAAHGDDARRAVQTGLRLVERMAVAAVELQARHGIEPAIRVGIHSGTVVIAPRADGSIDGSTIMGSAPNVTARLQGEAEPGTVVISDTTRQLVEPHFELSSIGTRSLKGISRPMELQRVVHSNLAVPLAGRSLPGQVALVGREGQSRLMRFTWNRLVHGSGGAPAESVVAVRGAPGIGKSALAADLVAHVQSEEAVVLEANCSPYHSNVALWPVARMIEQFLGFYPGQPSEERLAVLATRLDNDGLGRDAVPLLAPLLGIDVDERWSRPEVDALALRQATLETLVAWLAYGAALTPTLVVVEDLHWADPTSVDLLGLLAGAGISRAMILITSRRPIDAPWASSVLDIELAPLNEKDAAGLVSTLTETGLDEAQRRLVIERGTGNPLFLRELTRSALLTPAGEVLPPRIHEILAARLRAPDIDLRVAQLAATLGVEFDEQPLRQLAGRPLDEALSRLEAAEIIQPVAEVRVRRYCFHHALLRDAAYETQVLSARQESHRQIAELFGSSAASPGDLAVVAQHWDLAGDVPQAIAAYMGAAQAAVHSAASHTEARRQLERALELSATLPASDERDLTELMIRMQRAVSTSSLFGYGYPEVFEDFTVADEICRRLPDRPEITPAQVGIWSYLLVRGDVGAASAVLDPLTDVVDDPAMSWFAPEIKSCMGYSAFYQGRLDDAHRWLDDAWKGYRARSAEGAASPFWPLPHDAVPITAVALACVAALRGNTEESLQWERRAVATAAELGFPTGPFSSAFVAVYLAWLRMVMGDFDEAREFGRRTVEIADKYRFDYFRLLGSHYLLVPEPGRPCDQAELERCGEAIDLVGHIAFRPAYLGIVARNHHYLSDSGLALEVLDAALAQSTSSMELVHQPDLLRLRAEIRSVADPSRRDEAVADLVAAVDIGLAQGSLVLALRAANDLARLPDDDRPADWDDRVRSVIDRFPPSSSSPEFVEALKLLGV
jgi:class 3 adenylate cyclase/tetratricopeptide (TPR) repeat protein